MFQLKKLKMKLIGKYYLKFLSILKKNQKMTQKHLKKNQMLNLNKFKNQKEKKLNMNVIIVKKKKLE